MRGAWQPFWFSLARAQRIIWTGLPESQRRLRLVRSVGSCGIQFGYDDCEPEDRALVYAQ